MARTPRNLLDTRPVELELLVAQQQEVVADLTEWVADFVEASKEVAPKESSKAKGRKEHEELRRWPRLADDRLINVAGISGERGTGKTTVMLSALKLWRDAVRGSSNRGGREEEDPRQRARRLAEDLAGELFILDILDFDPLPRDLPILSWVVQAFQPLVEELGAEDGAELAQAWQGLFRTVTLGWDAGAFGGERQDLVGGVLDRESQVGEWHGLRETWGRFLDVLFRKIRGRGLTDINEPQVIVVPVDDLDLQVERLRECLHCFRLLTHPRVLFVATLHREHLVDVLITEDLGRMYRLAGHEGPDLPDLGDKLNEAPHHWAGELGVALADKVVRRDAVNVLGNLRLAEVLAWSPEHGGVGWLRTELQRPWVRQPFADQRRWALGLKPEDAPLGNAAGASDEEGLTTLGFLDRWPRAAALRVGNLRQLVQLQGQSVRRQRSLARHRAEGEATAVGVGEIWDLVEGEEHSWSHIYAVELDGVDRARRGFSGDRGCLVAVGGNVQPRRVLPPSRRGTQVSPRYGVPTARDIFARDLAWLYDRWRSAPYLNGPFLLWTSWSTLYPGVIAAWPIPLSPECPFELDWVQRLWGRFEPQENHSIEGLVYQWVRFWLASMRRPDVAEPKEAAGEADWHALLDHVWQCARAAEVSSREEGGGRGDDRMTTFAYRRLPMLAAPEYGLPHWLRRTLLERTVKEVQVVAPGTLGSPQSRLEVWRSVFTGERIGRLRNFAAWDRQTVAASTRGTWTDDDAGTFWAGAETETRVLTVPDGLWDSLVRGLAAFRPNSSAAVALAAVLPTLPQDGRSEVPLNQVVFQSWFPKLFPVLNAAVGEMAPGEFERDMAPLRGAALAGGRVLGQLLWPVIIKILGLPQDYLAWFDPNTPSAYRRYGEPISLRMRADAGVAVTPTLETAWEPSHLAPSPGWELAADPTIPSAHQAALVEAIGLTTSAMSEAVAPYSVPGLTLIPPKSLGRWQAEQLDEVVPWPELPTWLDHELLRIRMAVLEVAVRSLQPPRVEESEILLWEVSELLRAVASAFRGQRGEAQVEVIFRATTEGSRVFTGDTISLVHHSRFPAFREWLRRASPVLDGYLEGHLPDLLGKELRERL